MKPVVIIGCGGHAKVIVDILQSGGEYSPIGYTDPNKIGNILNLPILGNDEILYDIYRKGIKTAFVALGDNRARLNIAILLRDIGFNLINAISPNACISEHVILGCGIAIMPGAVINANSNIGDLSIINTGSSVDHDCMIGLAVHIAPGSHLAGCVTVDDGGFLGIGTNIIPDIRIGEWTVIGAGSTVINDIPPHSLAVGVPAKVIKVKK